MFVLTIPFSYILPFFHVPLFSSLSFPQPKISCFNSFLIIFWSDLLFPSIVFSQFLVPPPIIFLSSSIRRLIFALFPAFTLSFRALPAALQTNQKRQVCCPALPSPSRQKERRKKKGKSFVILLCFLLVVLVVLLFMSLYIWSFFPLSLSFVFLISFLLLHLLFLFLFILSLSVRQFARVYHHIIIISFVILLVFLILFLVLFVLLLGYFSPVT